MQVKTKTVHILIRMYFTKEVSSFTLVIYNQHKNKKNYPERSKSEVGFHEHMNASDKWPVRTVLIEDGISIQPLCVNVLEEVAAEVMAATSSTFVSLLFVFLLFLLRLLFCWVVITCGVTASINDKFSFRCWSISSSPTHISASV